MRVAREAGNKVALTLSDGFCVERHRDEFLELIRSSVDILFANEAEIRSLYEVDHFDDALQRAAQDCDLSLPDPGTGRRGRRPRRRGPRRGRPSPRARSSTRPAPATSSPPARCTGSPTGYDIATCARLGSLAAGEVISHLGPRPHGDRARIARRSRDCSSPASTRERHDIGHSIFAFSPAVITVIVGRDGPRRQPRRQLTRPEIGSLERPRPVFAEKGYDRAGVQEIARRAGLTTGAIYSRFTGKAELLQAAIEARTTDELDELFAEHRFEGHATDILRTVGSHLVRRLPRRRPRRGRAAARGVRGRPPRPRGALAARCASSTSAPTVLAELVEAAKLDGSIDPDLDTESLVRFCHAVGLGFLLFEAVDISLPDAEPWEQLITRLVGADRAGRRSTHKED